MIQLILMIQTMMTSNKKIALIVAAAGSSSRMGLGCKKEYLPLGEGTVLSTSIKTFLNTIKIAKLVVTIPHNGKADAENALKKDSVLQTLLKETDLKFVEGGKTRQESVFNALSALKNCNPDIVLIHDGARPFVTQKIISDTLDGTIKYGSAVPGLTPVDTQKLLDEDGFIKEHLTRSLMSAVQTPQGFEFAKLYDAHLKARKDNKEYTDDTEIWGKYVGKVKNVSGDPCNKKITFAEDYKKTENTMNEINIRTGLGYDLHRLVEGRKLVLGGIEIPFEKGEDGHSDGDVLLHAITDALLGASGLGDIGSYFPPEEPKWKDADSRELLKTVWKNIKNAGWKLINLDCVIKLERPKFLPHRQEVIDSIAKILETESNRIFVKAKTGEKLDSTGEGKAVETWATCLLQKD